MTDIKRIMLYAALAFLLVTTYSKWTIFKQERDPQFQAAQQQATQPTDQAVPIAESVRTDDTVPPIAASDAPIIDQSTDSTQPGNNIVVRTDVFEAVISSKGGNLIGLKLTQYPIGVDQPDVAFEMMQNNPPLIYKLQSGLISQTPDIFPNHHSEYQITQPLYELQAGEDKINVELSYQGQNQIKVIKRYIFHRDSYRIDIEYDIENSSAQPQSAFLYAQFERSNTQVDQFGVFGTSPSFTGGAFYTEEEKYNKLAFDKFAKDPLKADINDGWVAMLQHYFVGTLMIQDKSAQIYTRTSPSPELYYIGYKTNNALEIAPGQTEQLSTSAYIGPKDQDRLESQGSEGLQLSVDYGLLTVIATPIFWLLKQIHNIVGNWGWSIILLTMMIKLAFFPLSAASYKSMARMRKFQPRMASLKERFGGDRAKLNQEMMKMYKEEKINPASGCLPMLVQIPVFIALYWVLLESVELRQAPFILWIKDLSLKDPFYVLPLIYGASMFITQKLSPAQMDPLQRKIMMAMPIVFTVMFLFFPAGLVLYWCVNNILSIAQQWYINKKYASD